MTSRDISQAKIRAEVNISRATYFNWLKRAKPPPSESHQERLVKLFGMSKDYVLHGRPQNLDESKIQGWIVAEQGAGYEDAIAPAVDTSRGNYAKAPRALGKPMVAIPERMQVNPRFTATPPEPTAQECSDHFLTYLSHAAHARGGIGETWRKLQKHFPLDEFELERKEK